MGRLVVQVLGGTCDIAIDGVSVGVKSEHSANVHAGSHTVTCTVPSATPLRDEVTVELRGRPALVTFELGKSARTVPPKAVVNARLPRVE